MAKILDRENILSLHASSAYNEDGALLFLGPSGTGKSTMLRLLSPYMDALAEDKVYVAPQPDGKWQVIRGDEYFPIERKPACWENLEKLPGVMLKGVFRLYQAYEPKLENVDALTHCRYLTDAFFETLLRPRASLAVKQNAFVALAKIARTVPGYTFYFDLSPRTPTVLSKMIKI